MHISQPSGPPNEIRLLFSTVMKIMRNLKVEYYQEALINHNLNVTWDNIENELRRANGSYGTDKGKEWYQKETFQRLLRNLDGTNKQKLLLFLDDVLLQIPETNLVEALGDELRTRLNALSFNNQTIDQMRIFKRQWRGDSAETTTLHPPTCQMTYNIGGNYSETGRVMGDVDVFRDIHNATIINESLIVNSFNKVKTKLDEETSKTLLKLGKIIEQSGDASAGALLDKFNEELNKTQPEKSKLSNLWSGIVKVPPIGSDSS